MIFFIGRSNSVSFSRYLHFCVFMKSTDFKILDVAIGIATQWNLHLWIFLLNPIKMKFGQIQVCSMTTISNMILTEKDLELTPVLQVVQKIPENYFPCLFLSIGQVWWLKDLWFKRYIQKCTLSQVLILIMTSQIW